MEEGGREGENYSMFIVERTFLDLIVYKWQTGWELVQDLTTQNVGSGLELKLLTTKTRERWINA